MLVACAVASACVVGSSAAPTGLVVPFPAVAEDDRPFTTNVGDLNGDGRDDYATLICDPPGVEIAMSGAGDGFGLVRFDTSFIPASVTGVDADRDGFRDLVIVSRLGQVFDYRYGVGGGAFADGVEVQYSIGLSVQACDRKRQVVVGDITGDGVDEIVVLGLIRSAPGQTRDLMVVPLGTSEPAGRDDVMFEDTWPANTYDGRERGLTLTDVDADGDRDLLFVIDSDYFVSRNESGVLAAPTLFAAIEPLSSEAVLADLENDGVPDFVADASSSTQRLDLVLVRPDGTTEERRIDLEGPMQFTEDVANIGDVDGDGADDLLVGRSPAVVVRSVLGTPRVSPVPVRPSPISALVGKRDGVSELLTLGNGAVGVFPGGGTPPATWMNTLTQDTFFYLLGGSVPIDRPFDGKHVASADMNSDGRDELIVKEALFGSPRTWIFEIVDGQAELYEEAITGDYASLRSELVDVDGDGLTDITDFGRLLSGATVVVHRNNGSGLDARALWFDAIQFDRSDFGPDMMAGADFDGDKRDELIIPTGDDGSIIRFDLLGDATIGSTQYQVGGSPLKLVAADVNGDAAPDLFLSDGACGCIGTLLNDGSGGFSDPLTSQINLDEVLWLEVADLDADGFDDVVAVGEVTGGQWTLGIVWGNGVGGTLESVRLSFDVGSRPDQVRVLDIDADGMLDLVVTDRGEFSVRILYNRGARRWSNPEGLWQMFETRGFGTFDWDNDGRAELVFFPNNIGDSLVVYFSPEKQEPCVGDLNGDGRADFFDLAAFLIQFAGADPSADLAEPFGVFDLADVLAMVDAIAAGCP